MSDQSVTFSVVSHFGTWETWAIVRCSNEDAGNRERETPNHCDPQAGQHKRNEPTMFSTATSSSRVHNTVWYDSAYQPKHIIHNTMNIICLASHLQLYHVRSSVSVCVHPCVRRVHASSLNVSTGFKVSLFRLERILVTFPTKEMWCRAENLFPKVNFCLTVSPEASAAPRTRWEFAPLH